MLRLYMDEDSMDQALGRALRARGVDTLSALEAGMIGRTDQDQLNFATREGRVLSTFNVSDFWALHCEYLATGKHHAGIVLMHQQRHSTGEQLRRLLRLASALSADAMVDRAEYLSHWQGQA